MAGHEGGLIRAVVLDGEGGGRAVDCGGVRAWAPGEGTLWVHLDRSSPEARAWILDDARLKPEIAQALVQEGSRPRVVASEDGVLVILRGINHNPGRERSDMVSLRIWVEAERVISLRLDRMVAPQNVAERVLAGKGAETSAAILAELVRETADLITPVVDELEDQVDAIEERIVADTTKNLRAELAELRREAISLRRYLGPQRDALQRLSSVDIPAAGPTAHIPLLEQGDRMTRYVEDLDAVRERAVVASEELASRLSEQLNRRMYVLAIVTTVFLPLGLITGLLGINVGGIPGADDSRSFVIVAAGIVVLGLLQLLVLKRLRWM